MKVTMQRKNPRYPDLTPRRSYAVIGIEADDLRLLNDKGQPYLYPASLFTVLDGCEPADWLTEFGEDGERYAYPPPLNAVGFFEDFFDSKPAAVATFWQVVNQRFEAAPLAAAA
jgi:hypothetical protein